MVAAAGHRFALAAARTQTVGQRNHAIDIGKAASAERELIGDQPCRRGEQ